MHCDSQSVSFVAVCEYNGAVEQTCSINLQNYVMNTDTTSLSFATFLGLPQLIQCKKEDYIMLLAKLCDTLTDPRFIFMNSHNIVKFSNISETSTTDTVQK